MIKKLTFFLVVVWALGAVAEERQTLQVYHIGNSLTRSITMDRLHLLFAEHDIDYHPHDEATEKPTGDEFQSRDYFDKLLAGLKSEFDEPIQIIPVGEVWYECDRRIKAGALPGLAELYARDPRLVPGWKPESGFAAGVNVFYADGIHPNPIPHLTGNVANYVNGLTICTAIGGKSPMGLPGSIYGLDDEKDAALIEALRKTVWQVVTGELQQHQSR